MSNEATWNELTARVGGDNPAINAALLEAVRNYQTRTGCLPGGFDAEEWEDIFGDAIGIYLT